jgi:ATPase family associated with various cellular activities (AAA)
MKLDYILRSLLPDWKIRTQNTRNTNTKIGLSNFSNKYHVFTRGGLMRSNRKHFVIYSHTKEIIHKQFGIVAKKNFIVHIIYSLNNWPWFCKLRINVLRDLQSNFQIRDSVLPWINLHVYSALRGSIRSRYNVGKLVSSACLIYLALLDVRDGLYEFFSLLQNAFNISVTIKSCVNLIRIALPTLSLGPKDYRTLNNINTNKSRISLLLLSRPKTKSIINTVSLLLLPLVIYRIHPKFNYLINKKIHLDHFFGANSIYTSNIWSNYAIEPRKIIYSYKDTKWFKNQLSLKHVHTWDNDLNRMKQNNGLNLVLSNNHYVNTMMTYSQHFKFSNWNCVTKIQKDSDIQRIWKWYSSSMYQQKELISKLNLKSERMCTNLRSLKGFNHNKIKPQQKTRIGYSLYNSKALSPTLNVEQIKFLDAHQEGWLKQVVYDKHQIHVIPFFKENVVKYNDTNKLNSHKWWSGVFKWTNQITQISSRSRNLFQTTLSMIPNIQYGLNQNPINLFNNINHFKPKVFNNIKFYLADKRWYIVLRSMQFERERTIFRQKVNTWKFLSQKRIPCENQTCLWNIRNNVHNVLNLSVLKPQIEVKIINLLQDKTSVLSRINNSYISFLLTSVESNNQLLFIQNLYCNFIKFLGIDSIYKTWNIYPFKVQLHPNLSSNGQHLYFIKNQMIVQPFINFVEHKLLNNCTYTIKTSEFFEETLPHLDSSLLHTLNVTFSKQIKQFENHIIPVIETETELYQNRIPTTVYISLSVGSFEQNQIWNQWKSYLYCKDHWFLKQTTYVKKFIETCYDLNIIKQIEYKTKHQSFIFNIQRRFFKQVLMDLNQPINHYWYVFNNITIKEKYNDLWNNICSQGVMVLPYITWQQFLHIPSTSQHLSKLNTYLHNSLCTDSAWHLFWGTIPFSNSILPDTNIRQTLYFQHQDKIEGLNKQIGIIKPNKKVVFIQNKASSLQLGLYDSAQMLQMYDKWFFTSHWWNLFKRRLYNNVPIISQQIYDSINSRLLFVKQNTILLPNESLYSLIPGYISNFLSVKFVQIKSICRPILEQINPVCNNRYNFWSACQFIQHPTANEYAILTWLGILYIISFQCLSTYTGLAYVSVYKNAKKIRHLLDASWNTQLDVLVYKNTLYYPFVISGWESYCSQSKMLLIRGRVYSTLIGNAIIAKSLFFTSTLDLSIYNRETGILEQSLISREALMKFEQRHILMSNHRKFNVTSTQLIGMDYLRELTQTYICYPVHILMKNNQWFSSKSIYYVFDSINSNFFGVNTKQTTLPIFNKFQHHNSLIPVHLEHARSMGLLLIGTKESGKSYLVKSLAANAHVPIIRISVDSLISIQSDLLTSDFEIKINLLQFKLKVTKSLKKLAFMLDLAINMSPCIVWIPDIHKLCIDRDQNFQTMHANTVSLLTSLLTTMNELYKHHEHKILFVGSTNNTRQIDPGLITPMRFNKLIHLRMPSQSQRQERFVNLLRNNGIKLRNKALLAEVSNRTVGYSWRDLSGLINESLLIHSSQFTKDINTSIIRLALHRQIFGIDNTITKFSNQEYSENIPYKVGQAIIHSTLLNNRSMVPLYISQYLWKTRFYILSKICLEPNINTSSITELMTLPYICNCLAGSAGRDAWILSKGKIEEYSLSLSNQVKHDLGLASSLFEALFVQLALPNIYTKTYNIKNNSFVPKFRITENMLETIIDPIQKTTENLLNGPIIIENGIAKSILERSGTYINWSFRTRRFDLFRSTMFGVSKLFLDPTTIFSMTGHRKPEQVSIVATHQFESSPYERRMLKVQQHQEHNLQYQLNAILFKQRAESMGLPIIYTDLMEHEKCVNPIFLIGSRAILDLQVSSINNNIIFSRRNLLTNTDLLSILQSSYGIKRNIDKPRPKYNKPPSVLENEHTYTSFIPKVSNIDTKQTKKVSRTINFDWFRTIVQSNSYLQRPQLSFRIYSYQSWTSQSIADSLIRLDSLYYQQILQQQNKIIDVETLVWRTVVETYFYLLNILLKHYMLLTSVTDSLFQQHILFSEEMQYLHKYNLISLQKKNENN